MSSNSGNTCKLHHHDIAEASESKVCITFRRGWRKIPITLIGRRWLEEFCANLCFHPGHLAHLAHPAHWRISNLHIPLGPDMFKSHPLRPSILLRSRFSRPHPGAWDCAPLRGLQIPSAKNAAHSYRIDKMGVGWTPDVRANFCGHPEPPRPARKPGDRQTSREGSTASCPCCHGLFAPAHHILF